MKRKTAIEFLKAQAASLIGTMADFSLTGILFQLMGIHYAISTTLGAVCGALTNCSINYKWTFKCREANKIKVLTRYFLVWIGSVTLNSGMVSGFVFFFQNNETKLYSLYLLKIAVAIAVAFCWNFPLQKFYVFKNNNKI